MHGTAFEDSQAGLEARDAIFKSLTANKYWMMRGHNYLGIRFAQLLEHTSKMTRLWGVLGQFWLFAAQYEPRSIIVRHGGELVCRLGGGITLHLGMEMNTAHAQANVAFCRDSLIKTP